MILKGSQRSGGQALAVHLLRVDENDHVLVHELRGFVAEDIPGAFREAYAVSRGTKCRQYLFSLSLSPPPSENVPISVFEEAIGRIEARMGLIGHPRVIVFHEKNGRRHGHAVWSRIDAREMKAVNLAHFKNRLQDISRELFIEQGWNLPRGLVNAEEANPLNFSRAEWQQAKRIGRDPARIKEIFKQCWASSDNGNALCRALEARGYYLARGDRRGVVAVDWRGEIFALARWCGVKTKQLEERLRDTSDLLPVAEVSKAIAVRVAEKERGFDAEITIEVKQAKLAMKAKRDSLVGTQREERVALGLRQSERREAEARERASRLRKGLRGLWDWLTGRKAKTTARNSAELEAQKARDRIELEALIARQLQERRQLQALVRAVDRRQDRNEENLQTPAMVSPDRMNVPSRVVDVLTRGGPRHAP